MQNNPITIIDYQPALASHFDSINRQWIERMFVVEGIDDKVLKDPQKHIIDPGGYIWFAQHAELGILGTCALLNKGNGCYELTKMGVLEEARGLKAGEKLLQHILDFCIEKAFPNVFLLTNTKCEAAIHLYEKLGFVHDKETMRQFGACYERCNVAMRLQ